MRTVVAVVVLVTLTGCWINVDGSPTLAADARAASQDSQAVPGDTSAIDAASAFPDASSAADVQPTPDAIVSAPDVVAPLDAAAPADAACATGCGPGTACCSGVCVDIGRDRNNCGACGTRCRADLSCGGACGCAGGRFLCDIPGPEANVCTDVNTDFMHCGSCERPCPAGHGYTRCVGGVCMP